MKKAAYWSEHLRFFHYLSVASKVDTCIATAKKALEDGYCVIVGLQAIGEASAQRAAKGSEIEIGDRFADFISAPAEGLKQLIKTIIKMSRWKIQVVNCI